ncbi:leucine-rich repeat domain-containing protein [Pseudomonas sp. MYb118]|uniref:leucine-rich repeat domain-containing protein n=1 Tax=Pseudomonas sp. MYb118 TaxID=1848720 RepID=UPI0034CF0BC7
MANPQPFLAPLFVPLDKDREDNVDLWSCLFDRYRERMMADARSYAVPSAEIDARVRKQLFARLLDIGMLVLGAVSMFVPVLGEVTMTLVACQLLEESIAGVVEWGEGDRMAAKAHLLDVAQNLVLMGVTAGVGKGLAKLSVAPAPAVIEDLHPVTLPDGNTRLSRADLAGYETPDFAAPATFEPDSGPDAMGRYELDDKTYIRIDGKVFEQTYDRDLKRWRIRHPKDPQAYQPVLTHNRAGAWRHVLENPLAWNRLKLLRRIGHLSDAWSDEQLLQIADISETSDNALRRMHMDNGLPPPELVDTLRLFTAERDVTHVIEQVVSGAHIDERCLHVLPLVPELPGWPVGRTLQIFDSPGLTGVRVEYGRASQPPKPAIRLSRFDVLSGQMPARVLEALDDSERAELLGADAARERVWHPQVLREQIAAAVRARRPSLFNQFYRHRTQGLPLIDKLQRFHPGLSDAAAQDILAHASGGDITTLKSTDRVPRALHKEARCYVRRGRASGARARQALGLADGAAVSAPQGPGKRRFQPPRRIRKNLLGYPASGEGMLGSSGLNIALVLRLQHLYPDLEMAEANGIVLALIRSGQSDAQILQMLEQLREQWLALEQTLESWVTQGGNVEQKAEVALSLRNTWRGRPFAEENAAYRQLELVCDEPLPTLTADFSHVTTLRLRVPSSTDQQIRTLLRNFSGVINLDLRSNRLITNPIARENAGHLLNLDLSDNPLYQLDVSAMTQLEVLILKGTQLQEWPTGADTLWHLDWLDLRATRIRELPPEALARDELLINTNLSGAPLSETARQQLQLAWQRCESTLGLPDATLARFFREPVPEHTIRPFENGTLLASRLLLLPPRLPAEQSTASFVRRLRRVDPALTEGEAMAVIEGWRVGVTDAWVNAHIEAWGQRFEAVTRQLNGWIFSRRTGHPLYGGRWSSSQRRSEAAEKILACWKRGLREAAGENANTLDLSNIDGLGELPQLPAGFDHVQSLNLRGNGLQENDLGGFLPAFSQLCSLDLGLNRLERLPQAAAGLTRLQALGLSSNRFSDLAILAQDLGAKPRLETLRLSYNRIKAFNGTDLESLPGLRHLELNFNQLNRFDGPIPPLLNSLHLNGNDLHQWPDGVLQAPSLEVLNLAGNPINEIPVEAFDGSHDQLLVGTQLFGIMRYLSTDTLNRLLGHLDRVGSNSALGISRDNIERWLANPEWVAMEE